MGGDDMFADVEFGEAPEHDDNWMPGLNPMQVPVFNNPTKYLLVYGEKGSGKGIICLHKLVRHCYENNDALGMIFAPTQRSGSLGVFDDLEKFVLPAWREGNQKWVGGKSEGYLDRGMGLQFTPARLDSQTKDRVIKIQNRHGGNSTVMVISVPYDEAVDRRMRGLQPSFVFVDELTKMGGPEFFTYIVQQLGRRRGIEGPQQYVAACNPEGPSHWVWQLFWQQCMDADGIRDPDYQVCHLPIHDNDEHLQEGYFSGLKKIFKDPYDARRNIDGEWVDRPSGDAIFREYFIPEIHSRGDSLKNIGLLSLRGHPIIVGHDPGPKNYSITLLQRIPIESTDKDKALFIWNAFDGLNFVGEYRTYSFVARELFRRLRYWMDHKTVGYNYKFAHVFDEAAFTQRDKRGSYDVLDMKREMSALGMPITATSAPKGADSQPQRVQLICNMFLAESLFISNAMWWSGITDMLMLLISQKVKDGDYDPYQGLRPARSPHLHPFDSLSYPIWKYHVQPGRLPQQEEPKAAGVFWAGRK